MAHQYLIPSQQLVVVGVVTIILMHNLEVLEVVVLSTVTVVEVEHLEKEIVEDQVQGVVVFPTGLLVVVEVTVAVVQQVAHQVLDQDMVGMVQSIIFQAQPNFMLVVEEDQDSMNTMVV